MAVPERPLETMKKACVRSLTAPSSALDRDDHGFAADAGFGQRAIKGAPRLAEPGLSSARSKRLRRVWQARPSVGIADIIVAHQQERLHRKAGRALGDLETQPLDEIGQRGEIEIIEVMRRGDPPLA